MRRFTVDIDSPRVREITTMNAPIFKQAMNGMVEACQVPGEDAETNVALVLRSAVAYASGICHTFNVSHDEFRELMALFTDAKIGIKESGYDRVRFPKGKQ